MCSPLVKQELPPKGCAPVCDSHIATSQCPCLGCCLDHHTRASRNPPRWPWPKDQRAGLAAELRPASESPLQRSTLETSPTSHGQTLVRRDPSQHLPHSKDSTVAEMPALDWAQLPAPKPTCQGNIWGWREVADLSLVSYTFQLNPI